MPVTSSRTASAWAGESSAPTAAASRCASVRIRSRRASTSRTIPRRSSVARWFSALSISTVSTSSVMRVSRVVRPAVRPANANRVVAEQRHERPDRPAERHAGAVPAHAALEAQALEDVGERGREQVDGPRAALLDAHGRELGPVHGHPLERVRGHAVAAREALGGGGGRPGLVPRHIRPRPAHVLLLDRLARRDVGHAHEQAPRRPGDLHVAMGELRRVELRDHRVADVRQRVHEVVRRQLLGVDLERERARL
jgi:hypothetical protein